jgi:hypothetical protein
MPLVDLKFRIVSEGTDLPNRWIRFNDVTQTGAVYYRETMDQAQPNTTGGRIHSITSSQELFRHILIWLSFGDSILPGWGKANDDEGD